MGQLANLIKLGMDRGDFAPCEPFLAAATVLGMVNIPHILFHSGKLTDPALRDRMEKEVLFAAMDIAAMNSNELFTKRITRLYHPG